MRRQPNSRMCFVCGRQNPVGLKLEFYEDQEKNQLKAEVVVADTYQGYPGVVHGGIISAVLDEVAGRAVMIEGGDENLLVTLRLTVRFRRPTPTETPLTAVGWVQHAGEIGVKVAAEIRLPDGTVTAEGEALLAEPPACLQEAWEDEKPFWKVYD